MSTEVLERTALYLDNLGLLSGYSPRYHRWHDDDLNQNTPVAVFRHTGDGNSDTFKQEYDVTITLLAASISNTVAVGDAATAIVKAFRGTGTVAGVIKFEMLGNQQGPFYLENDRPLYQINVRVFTEDQ